MGWEVGRHGGDFGTRLTNRTRDGGAYGNWMSLDVAVHGKCNLVSSTEARRCETGEGESEDGKTGLEILA